MPPNETNIKNPTKARLRQLWIYTIDPSLAISLDTFDVAATTVSVPWEELTSDATGFSGEYIEIIDYDPAVDVFYKGLDVNGDDFRLGSGLVPAERDPRFHQQMCYAVVMRTIQTFEGTLGRRVLWSPNTQDRKKDFVERLRVYPHALREANAYYDNITKSLLFSYFPAEPDRKGRDSENKVFTALSFDVISHETTHAILDGIHPRFIENSNVDAPAFHEAFADIVALFQHFSIPSLLKFVINKTRGQLDQDNFLAQLAVQFGQGIGNRGALRDAIGTYDAQGNWTRKNPSDFDVDSLTECHERGAILVSAVFDAFLRIYQRRTADLYRICTNGTGVLGPGAISPDLVNRLADEAELSARHVVKMCVRALDYMPPVDPTFPEFLRAILTADADAAPIDPIGYRTAFVEAFRRWGLAPYDTSFVTPDALLLDPVVNKASADELRKAEKNWFDLLRTKTRDQVATYRSLEAWGGKPHQEKSEKASLTSRRQAQYDWSRSTAKVVHACFEKLPSASQALAAKVFGIDFSKTFEVHSVRIARRQVIDEPMAATYDLVILATEKRFVRTADLQDYPIQEPKDSGLREALQSREVFMFRGGSTMIYDVGTGDFRYVIRKNVNSESRRRSQRDYQMGTMKGLYFGADSKNPFRGMHGVQS